MRARSLASPARSAAPADPDLGTRRPAALLFDPGPDRIAGVMGALKAGRTPIPLDPRGSEKKARRLLETSGVRVILTTTAHMALAGRLRDPVNGNIGIIDLKDLPADPAPRRRSASTTTSSNWADTP